MEKSKKLKRLDSSVDANEKNILDTIKKRFESAKDYQHPIFNKFVECYEYYRGIQTLESTWRSQVNVPYIQQIVDTVLPRLVSAKPKINVLPVADDDIESAQNNEKFVNYQWENLRMYQKVKMWVKSGLLYGVGLVKVGWEDKMPTVDIISNYDFFIDPNATTIDDSSYCIYKQERDLTSLKKNKNYKNIDKLESAISSLDNAQKNEERAALGRSSVKSDRKKVVVYEYYGRMAKDENSEEKDYLIVTANNEVILRMDLLDDVCFNGKPFVAFKDIEMPLDFWAIGEVEPLIPLEDELNTLRNQRLDNRKLILNPMWQVNENAGVKWEDFVSRPGGIVRHDGSSNAIEQLILPDVTGGSVQEEAIIKGDMDRTSGVFPGMMGQNQAPEGSTAGNINTTARGFLASIEMAGTRMQYKLDNLDDALKELGQKLLKMNRKYITEDQKVRIIGKAGIKFEDVPLSDIDKEYDLRIEGGATQPQNREVKKRDAIQILQMLMPLSNVPMMEYEPGKMPSATKMNAKFLVDAVLDTFDIPNKEEAFIPSDLMGLPPVNPAATQML